MSHIDEGLLHALADGAIGEGDDEYAAISGHLAFCADCRTRLAEARELRDHARDVLAAVSAPAGAGPDFDEVLRLAGRTPAGTAPVPAPRRSRARRTVTLAWAASLGVAVGAGWMARSLRVELDADEPAIGARAGAVEEVDAARRAAAGANANEPVSAQSAAPTAGVATAGGDAARRPAAVAQRQSDAAESRSAGVPAVASAADAPAPPVPLPALEPQQLAGRSPDPVVASGIAPRTAADSNVRIGAPVEPIRAVDGPAGARASLAAVESQVLEQRLARTSDVGEIARAGAEPPPTPVAAEPPARVTALRGSGPPAAPPASPRATPDRRAAEPSAERSLISRLLGGGSESAQSRTRWRAVNARDAERRLGRAVAVLPDLPVIGQWASEEAGIWTIRTEQRTADGSVVELLQWHDPVTARLGSDADAGYVTVVRSTERSDGSAVVFVDVSDGSHASVQAALPLAAVLDLARSLQPANAASPVR